MTEAEIYLAQRLLAAQINLWEYVFDYEYIQKEMSQRGMIERDGDPDPVQHKQVDTTAAEDPRSKPLARAMRFALPADMAKNAVFGAS